MSRDLRHGTGSAGIWTIVTRTLLFVVKQFAAQAVDEALDSMLRAAPLSKTSA
jgi:hypothetical protein